MTLDQKFKESLECLRFSLYFNRSGRLFHNFAPSKHRLLLRFSVLGFGKYKLVGEPRRS